MKKLRNKLMSLYDSYRLHNITLEEYIIKVRPLDEEMRNHEIAAFKSYIKRYLTFEKSS